MKIRVKEIPFSERGFLERLRLLNPDVAGLRSIYINNRYVAAPDEIRKIVVVLNMVEESQDA